MAEQAFLPGILEESEVSYTPRSGSRNGQSSILYIGPGTSAMPRRQSMAISRRLTALAEAIKRPLVAEAGWWKDTLTYENGESVVDVARLQEYGGVALEPNWDDRLAPKSGKRITVPPRPFLRPTLLAHRKKYVRFVLRGMIGALRAGERIEPVMEQLSHMIAADIRRMIENPIVAWKPLAFITIARRKHLWETLGDGGGGPLEKPLEDTRRMINSIEARSYAK